MNPVPSQVDLTRAERSLTRLDELFGLFNEEPPVHELLSPTDVPEPQRSLLDHERHMTVTLERHHQTRVTLEVLEHVHSEPFYARKIMLRHANGVVVQYGIMRFDLRRVQAEVRHLILEGNTPLGRILIEHEVLRRISTHGLLSLQPGRAILDAIEAPTELAERPGNAHVHYGRLATILCNESPAVDLLEVVTGL